MDNTIQTVQNNSVEKFINSRIKDNNARAFWIPAQNNNVGGAYNTGDVSKIFITPDEARKTNNTRVIGLSIASATIMTAAGVFFLLKGGPKGIAKGFRNLKTHIEHEILTSKLNTNSAPNKIMLYILKATNTALAHAEAINNITTIKDVIFKKIMGFTKFTEKIHNKITQVFGAIGRKTVKNSYASTAGKFKELKAMSKSISEKLLGKNPTEVIEIDGISMTKAEWIERIGTLNEEIAADYSAHFTETAVSGRFAKMKKAVSVLYDKFKNIRVFFSKDTLTSFMAESILAEEKAGIQQTVRSVRNRISYNLNDMLASVNDKIIDISKDLGYKDSKHIKDLGSILGNIKSYVHSGGTDIAKKEQILDGISTLKNEIQTLINSRTISPEDGSKLLTKIDDLYSGIAGYQEGKAENILKIYKKLLPADEYDVISRAYKKGVSSLDESIKIETEDFMSKLRDLTLGSAPTDILTILASLGVLGYQLGKSKDNDQRQSIALKYGFPAIAGIGVSLYCNAKLYAGSKSLAVGAISTWVLNKIGEWGDKKLKEFKGRKSAQTQS